MPLKKLYARRLLKLADLLDALPRRRFDYGQWVGDGWETGKSRQSDLCGTTGCALGWATTLPSLRRAGLRMSEGGDPIGPSGCGPNAAVGILTDTVEQSEQLFVPRECGADNIFSPLPSEATPKQVAKHIRRKVAEWSAP